MQQARFYGIAIILGTLGGIITMALHPTGADLLKQTDEIARRNEMIALGVHTLAIISLPLCFFGLIGFCRRLGFDNPLNLLGLVIFGLGEIAVMSAAVLSGLVGPVLTRRILESDEQTKATLYPLLMNNYLINQGFSKVYVVALAASIGLWSVSLLKQGRLMQITAILGFTISVVSIIGIFSGHLKLDVHGFGAFIFAQAIWMILAAIFTMRKRDNE